MFFHISIDRDFEIKIKKVKESIESNPRNGWSEGEHFHFVKIYREYHKYSSSTGKNTLFQTLSDITNRLIIEMPQKSKKEIEAMKGDLMLKFLTFLSMKGPSEMVSGKREDVCSIKTIKEELENRENRFQAYNKRNIARKDTKSYSI
jgi:hypothetical protein